MKRIFTFAIVLLMAFGSMSAQQYVYIWKTDGSHISYPVTDIDSIGFYAPFYTVVLTAEGNGTVTGDGEYPKGTPVTLVATAENGYSFSQWSDGNTDNPRTVILNDNLSLTATFVLSVKYFSVSPTTTVLFSPGNLQYTTNGTHLCADGTTQTGTWRFAEHQWDIVGCGYGQTYTANDNMIGGLLKVVTIREKAGETYFAGVQAVGIVVPIFITLQAQVKFIQIIMSGMMHLMISQVVMPMLIGVFIIK